MGKTKGIKQREYDEEFKMDSEKNYFESGKSVKNVSDELGIPDSTFRPWIEKYRSSYELPPKNSNEELIRLKRELYDVKMERDILKKAMAIFSKTQK